MGCLQHYNQDFMRHCERKCAWNPFKDFKVAACVVRTTTNPKNAVENSCKIQPLKWCIVVNKRTFQGKGVGDM